jgi:two-component system, NarL family, nitrate/nitrite response regulator NarL
VIQLTGCDSVVVGSYHQLMAEGVAGLLTEGGCKDVRVAYSPEAILAAVDERKPDIVVLDGCMWSDDVSLIRTLCERGQPVALVIGADWSGTFLMEAIEAGAGGCLSYDEELDTFILALGLIAKGGVVMSKKVARNVVEAALNRRIEAHPDSLSAREGQIARLVAQGATNKEIADSLFISEHTVKIHLGHILEKLNLRNRQQVAVFMAEQGDAEGEAS